MIRWHIYLIVVSALGKWHILVSNRPICCPSTRKAFAEGRRYVVQHDFQHNGVACDTHTLRIEQGWFTHRC